MKLFAYREERYMEKDVLLGETRTPTTATVLNPSICIGRLQVNV